MDLLEASLRIIRAGQYPSGAYVASPTFPVYRYCWVRDGAFIAWAMDEMGEAGSADAFHRFVADCVQRNADKVEGLEREIPSSLSDADILHTRYTLDGVEGKEDWPNFQLDGYGFWLSAVARHLEFEDSSPLELLPAVELTCRYLSLLWDRLCADCWEEFADRRHPATLAAVAGGLRRAAELLEDDRFSSVSDRIIQHLRPSGQTRTALAKFEGTSAIDGSALLVLGPLGPFPYESSIAASTLGRVESVLVIEGGVHRYLDDEYYGGGLWLPLSGALAAAHAARGDLARAGQILEWMEGTVGPGGGFPEQMSTSLRRPVMLEHWMKRWGPVASPLLWSHAMYVIARRLVEG
jgi:isomaltose glucohydrolase